MIVLEQASNHNEKTADNFPKLVLEIISSLLLRQYSIPFHKKAISDSLFSFLS
ncbi:hypothetical protein ENLAB_25460 [Enterococcus innesii]|uniref:Uncharacterized protein n=1 Tax=Enterococcus innesii TaxID=2839759 RepID=A0ABM7XV13_9ENTE|nr:hypothetical protein ENLAB_25460 [Enterococcus innesii]